ncbi:MAG: metallophosphoesterase, partial [Actinomycetaceae bacterium]
EDATFMVDIGSNAMGISYGNYLVINGTRVTVLEQYSNATTDIPVPYELLVHGENTITLGTGARTSGCGINHDDFVATDFRLSLADGTEIRDEANPATITLGDGNCGSNAERPRTLDLTFTIDGEPGEESGLLHAFDTTSVEDGEHAVTATTEAGASTTQTYTVDNTGPALASSTPAVGDTVVGDVVVAAEVADEAGVRGDVTVSLDGAPVRIGDTISSDDLVQGEHELVVQAQDELGNTSRHVVPFTTATNSPTLGEMTPASGTTDVGDAVDLSIDVTDPNGSEVTTTFYAADPARPATAHQGIAEELPLSQLDFTGQEEAATDALRPGDGEVLRSPAGEGVSYQRFDVPVETDGADEMVVSWSGEVDPARGVRLHAWNPAEGSWEQLHDVRGADEGQTHLSGAASSAHDDEGVVHLLVEGYDPFADDIGDAPDEAFRDPETYDFSLAHVTDTQYYSEGATQRESEEERTLFADSYRGIVDWIVANEEERNIAYAFHTGDITENHILPTEDEAWNAQVRAEYEFADEMQSVLDDAGIPNGVLPGNHDNMYGANNDLYNEFFGPERYEAISEGWENAEYGGPWREGDNSAHYDLFTAGGLDFIAVHLPYSSTQAQLTWAREILAEHPDRNGIVASHDYLAASTSPDGRGAGYSAPDGQPIFDEVVSQSPNVFLTLAGHIHGVATNVLTDVAEPGHNVVEMLADYQAYQVDGERATGFLRLLQFDVERSEMTVDTYSPRLDNHGATEFDGSERYDGTEDETTLPIDLSSRTTSIATDSVSVAVLSDEVIGESTVSGEGTATAEWTGLTPGEAHGWYAVAENATDGRTVSPLATFTTAGDGEEPGEPEPPVEPAPGIGFFLNNGWDTVADTVFEFGRVTDETFVGDWDGDGVDTLALRRGNQVHVTNDPAAATAEAPIDYGRAGDVLLAGDFDGDGADSFAVRRGNEYLVLNTLVSGDADEEVAYGRADDEVLVGDWDGDALDTFTVRRGNEFFVANEVRDGWADQELTYGRADDTVLVGDWDGDELDSFAVRRGNSYFVKNAIADGDADIALDYGRADDTVLVGDWDGDGTDTLGVRR